MKPDETPMFDPSLLKEVDWSQNTAIFSPAISPTHPGEGLVLRPLCTADLNKGFFKVLGQLTETGVVSPEQFMKSFEHMKKSGDYYVTVVEDVTLGQIVATATLIIEHKFIHSCAKRGRVEDVVVSDECRGKQLGKLIGTEARASHRFGKQPSTPASHMVSKGVRVATLGSNLQFDPKKAERRELQETTFTLVLLVCPSAHNKRGGGARL